MLSAEEVKKLKVARAKCDESLMFFTRFFFKEVFGIKFQVNWHHEDICEAFEETGNYTSKYETVIINIPPRMGKTSQMVAAVARGIGMNPLGNYLYIAASDELRSQVSVQIRDIVTHPYFRFMYGVELKKDQNSKNLWKTEQGGGLKTATIFGQITGFGAGLIRQDDDSEQVNKLYDEIEKLELLLLSEDLTIEGEKIISNKTDKLRHAISLCNEIRNFEGCISLDDLNKMDDSENLTANNDKVKRILFNTVFSRKNSEDTPIWLIQQRAGVEDATSAMLEYYETTNSMHKVKLLRFPIVNEFTDERRGIIKGKSLWSRQMSDEKIEQLRTSPLTSRMFQSQYMQDPQGRLGEIFEERHFTIINESELPFDTKSVTRNFVIDGAFKDEEQHDETAQGCFYYNREDGNMYVFNICGVRKNLDKYLKWFNSYAKANNINSLSRVYIELKASGDSLKTMLRKPDFGGYNTIGVNDKFVNQGKMFRAETTLPFADANKIVLVKGAWNRSFIDQCLGFPHAKHDDMVDVLTYMSYYSFIKKAVGASTSA